MIKSIWLILLSCLCCETGFAQLTHYTDSAGKKHAAIFQRHVFRKDAVLYGAHFLKHTDINHADFRANADISHAVFAQPCDFNHAHFEHPVTFEQTTFEGRADMNNSQFDAAADFRGAVFHAAADFNHGVFDKTADFSGATFSSSSDLNHVTFLGTVDFSHARFDSTVNFNHATFKGTLKLNNLDAAHSRFDFNGVELPDTIDLSNNPLLDHEIDLTTAKPDTAKKHYIMLTGSKIAMVHIHYDHFQLYFPPQADDRAIKATYSALLENFKKHNDTASYEKLKTEYKVRFQDYVP